MAENMKHEMARVKYEETYNTKSYLHKEVDKLLREKVWLKKCLSDEQENVKTLQDENQKLQMIVHTLEKEGKMFHKDFRQTEKTDQNNNKHLSNFCENRGNVRRQVEIYDQLEKYNGGTADLQLTKRRLNCDHVTQRKEILDEECIQNELDKLHRENTHLREELENERNLAKRYKHDYKGFQLKFDILSKENIRLKADYETQGKLTKQTVELKEQVKQLLQEKEKLNKDLCHEKMVRQTNETVSRMNEHLKEETHIMPDRNEILQNKVDKLLHEKQTLKDDLNIEKANSKMIKEELLKRIQGMQHNIENKEQEIISLRRELKNINEFTSANRKIDPELENKFDSNEVLQQQLTDAKVQLINTQKELDDTKSRLSRAMGDKLTDNNPNIADLSDKNRPTKISERYQELYDNQWTDAFEIIDETLRGEEKTIQVLKEILLGTMEFCKTEAANQMLKLQATLLKGEECSPSVYKQAKDIRKAVAELYGKGLYKDYWTTISKTSFAKQIPNFVKECFGVCWLMVVQDPPVVFGPVISRHDIFNKDHYKSYTRGGERIDYVVWPVLLLHLNGPVLCKGVAQGMVE